MEAYRGALALDQRYRPAAANLARLLVTHGRPRAAARLLEPIMAGAPFDVALAVNYANALMGIGRIVEAEQRLLAVVATETAPSQAHNSLGVARYIRRNFSAAREAFSAAIAADSSFAEAHENLAQALLQLGDEKDAWAEYEWRWRNPSNNLTKRLLAAPSWDGTPLHGRTLLLHGEQGHGDTIQFVRFARLVERGTGGKVVFACQQALYPLLSTVPGVDEVCVLGDELPPHDCQAPVVSLRRLRATRINGTPLFDAPYIRAEPDPEIAARAGLKIGINWTGKPLHPDDPHRNRSCPPEFFAALAAQLGATLYSLQYRADPDELARTGAVDLGSRIESFADTARFVAALDLVVTIDTALAHIAGALAKPCWVLPPYTADWRWTARPDGLLPWYPSTRAVRQDAPGDWAGSFRRLAEDISRCLARS